MNFNHELTRFLFGNFKLFWEGSGKLKVILELYILLLSCLVHRHLIKESGKVQISMFTNKSQPTAAYLGKLLVP